MSRSCTRSGHRGQRAYSCLVAAEGLCTNAVALGVGAPETARTELLSEDAILFLEIVNDVTLLLVDPARDGHDEELKHLGKRRHTGRA